MVMDKPIVVVTRRLPQTVEACLSELFELRLNVSDQALSGPQIIAAAKNADVLVPTVTDRIDAGIIDALPPGLGLVANFGVGVDHIDLSAAWDRDIVVTNTPGVLTEDTAELAIALILAVMRRLGEGDRLARSGAWTGWTPTFMLGVRLGAKRLGIVGMGRIGQAVAHRARAFGCEIHYHNRHRVAADIEAALSATYWDDLDAMLAEMDIVSLNCPRTRETFHLISADRLALMRPDAVIVNSARGDVIDEAALTRALARGDLAGAGLDVYEREPEIAPELRALENVVLAPHLGSATREARIAMGEKVIENILAFSEGRSPPDSVPPR